MNEALILQIAVGLTTIGGAWAVMRTQLQQAREEIDELKKTMARKDDLAGIKEEVHRLTDGVGKVSLQVAYLNGQLAARGIVPPSLPAELKTG